jgi:hypothetical protein
LTNVGREGDAASTARSQPTNETGRANVNSGLGRAIIGLVWAAALGLPFLAMVFLFGWSGGKANPQILGLCVLAALVGGLLAFRVSQRISESVSYTRKEVMARLRSATSPEEARRAAQVAAVFAGDPGYSEEIENLSDSEVLRLCKEILRRNEPVGRLRR